MPWSHTFTHSRAMLVVCLSDCACMFCILVLFKLTCLCFLLADTLLVARSKHLMDKLHQQLQDDNVPPASAKLVAQMLEVRALSLSVIISL